MGSHRTLGLVVLLVLLSHGQCRTGKNDREAKLLFNIINFQNTDCPARDENTGTCFTQSECAQKRGQASGNCAAGFGVCCVFIQKECDDASVNQNNSYIQNEEFPRGTFEPQTCAYGISPLANSDICQLRLDFVTFNIQGPDASGDCLSGLFVAITPLGNNAPLLCGNLGGQHMYLDTQTIPGSTELIGGISITTGVEPIANAQNYKIKVTYLECTNPARAPQGCLQYFEGPTARIRSYNYGDLQIKGQRYAHCFRQEPGTCSFAVQEAPSTDGTGSFSLTEDITSSGAVVEDCSIAPSYIGFPIAGSTGSDMRCGEVFGLSNGDTAPSLVHSIPGGTPFIINFFALPLDQLGARGFDLLVRQVAC